MVFVSSKKYFYIIYCKISYRRFHCTFIYIIFRRLYFILLYTILNNKMDRMVHALVRIEKILYVRVTRTQCFTTTI